MESAVSLIAVAGNANVRETEMISGSVQEQTASMEEIASASQSLSRLAEELHAASSRFQI